MSKAPLEKPESDFSAPKDRNSADHVNGAADTPEIVPNQEDIPNSDETPTVLSKHKPGSSEVESSFKEPLASLQGRSLAHFDLVAPIGVGGMAAVLLARDRQLDRIVALKILPPDMADESEMVQRFHQEARAAAKLDHENIARVFYCGEDQGLHFIAFEFVEGDNLRSILEQRGIIPVEEAVQYMLQIAAGLSHASQRGVVHRDIKPSNIIIAPQGRAKLVDMGLARTVELRSGTDLTQSGVTLGTFEYISPEQALEPRQADVRSDIYSLGCTFYHMLTGRAAVPEGTAAKKLHHHQHVAPIDPRQLNPAIPDNVAAILSRMMAKNPADRYQSAEHLVQHLLQTAQELGIADKAVEGVRYLDMPLPPPPQKRVGLMIGMGLAALVALMVLLSFAPTDSGGDPVIVIADPADLVNDRFANGGPQPVPPDPPIVQPHADDFIPVKDAADIFAAMKMPADGPIKLLLQDNITFAKEWLIERELILKSSENGPFTISRRMPDNLVGKFSILRIKEANVEIHDVRFLLETKEHTRRTQVAAITVEQGGRLTAKHCRFRQDGFAVYPYLNSSKDELELADLKPMASVLLRHSNGTGSRPIADFVGCWFRTGQVAVAVEGTAEVQHTQCAFGPHHSHFHLYGNGKTQLSLTHCSALVVYGPVLRLDDHSKCELNLTNSIFSVQDPEHNPPRDRRYFIYQKDTTELLVRYTGSRNCFHNLDDFWGRPGEEFPVAWSEFRQKHGDDSFSSYLAMPAFEDKLFEYDPLDRLDFSPWEAFRVNPALAEVRQLTGGKPAQEAIGVLQFARQEVYDQKLPALQAPSEVVDNTDKDKKIVDGKGEMKNRFKTLAAAIFEAAEDDVIYLQTSNVVVRSIDLQRKKKVTIKPYGKTIPVVTLDSESEGTEKAASLFKLNGGQITFENITFRLQPDRNFSALSIINMMAGGKCVFKNCRITLLHSQFNTELQVVSFPSAARREAMMENKLSWPAAIEMYDCLVRGEGEFISLQQAAPFHLKVEDSLIGLKGSFLYVDGNLDRPIMDSEIVLELNRTTTYLTGHLLYLVQQAGKSLMAVKVRPSNCLFLSAADADEQQPLIYLEGLQNSGDAERLIKWTGQPNGYCGYHTILNAQLAQANMSFPSISTDNWYTKDMQANSGTGLEKPRFLTQPLKLAPTFTTLEPSDLELHLNKLPHDPKKDETPISKYGAALNGLQNRIPRAVTVPTPSIPFLLPSEFKPLFDEE